MSGDELGYDLRPETFNDLLASAIGMAERRRVHGDLPYDESVVLTIGAALDLVQIVADLRARVALLEQDITR